MAFSMIVAADAKRGIGYKNNLPWRIKGDMQWFKQTTITKHANKPNCVIMGRKTWESIPDKFRPLPQRVNIVISHHPESVQAPHVVSSFDKALILANSFGGDIFVIGGASIYQIAFQHEAFQTLYITEIEKTFACDTFFPEYDHLRLVDELAHGEEDGLVYRIRKYTL